VQRYADNPAIQFRNKKSECGFCAEAISNHRFFRVCDLLRRPLILGQLSNKLHYFGYIFCGSFANYPWFHEANQGQKWRFWNFAP
jgi:hypothetical protein